MFERPHRRRIVLMRHAEAAYLGADGTPAPDGRLVPLTPLGRDQATHQATALREVSFDRAICSGLPRTVETATIVLAGRAAPALEVVPALEEIRGGQARGPAEDLAGWIAHVANPWADAEAPDARFLGGERFRDFEARVLPAFEAVLRDDSWRTLLLVLHGGVNRVLLNRVMNLPWQGAMSIEQDPACINIVDVDGRAGVSERFLIRGVNITAYNLLKIGIELTDMERAAEREAARSAGGG